MPPHPDLPLHNLYAETGRRIGKVRKARGMSQEQLAKMIGLSRTSVTNIEKGRQKLPLHTLYEIAATLGMGVEELLPRREELVRPLEQKLPRDITPKEREWISQIVEKRGAKG